MDNKSESCGFCPNGLKIYLYQYIKDDIERVFIDNVIADIKEMKKENDRLKQKYESLYIKQ
jgi:hypothetical protein